MNYDAIVRHCNELLEMLPAQAVARAREQHPDVRGLAVFPVYAPVEIIHAAGLMPVGLFGVGNKLEISHADSRFQSFICSIAKSTLELFLRQETDGIEGVVFSSICDVARNLASLVKRNAPQLFVEFLHLPQNMSNSGSAAYTRAEFERFRTNLSSHIRRPITDAAVAASLDVYNKVRSLIRALYARRKEHPGSIPTADLYAVVQAGTRMMPEDYLPILEAFLAEARQRNPRPRDSVHVVLEGAFCEQPPALLIDTIEGAGCQIKDDDLVVGFRWFHENVGCNGDPMGALAEAYLHCSVYSSVRHDWRHRRTDGLLRRVQDAGAAAVVFTPAKFCEPALLDYVPFVEALDKNKIPHIKLEFEEKMWTFDASRTEVETFSESMLFE